MHKNISIQYKTDTGIVSFKGKTSDYEFPYLVLKRKNDSIVIDVRRIEKIRFASSTITLNYVGAVITANITITLIANRLIEFAIIPATLSFVLIASAHRKLNTKTEWHFY